MTHTPELIEKLRAIAQEAAPYIEAGGGIIGHLEIALSKAAYAARDEEREACANIAKNAHLVPMVGTMIDPRSGELIANIIRERNQQ